MRHTEEEKTGLPIAVTALHNCEDCNIFVLKDSLNFSRDIKLWLSDKTFESVHRIC